VKRCSGALGSKQNDPSVRRDAHYSRKNAAKPDLRPDAAWRTMRRERTIELKGPIDQDVERSLGQLGLAREKAQKWIL
jgi:hypothetical protein